MYSPFVFYPKRPNTPYLQTVKPISPPQSIMDFIFDPHAVPQNVKYEATYDVHQVLAPFNSGCRYFWVFLPRSYSEQDQKDWWTNNAHKLTGKIA